MASLEEYLAAIKALHACGLNFSAISLIEKADRNFGDTFRGSEINRLVSDVRKAAKFPKIGPGIYALTSFEGVGVVVPIQAEEGAARIDDPSASEAWHTAHEFVLANRKEFLSQRPSSLSMPILKPVLPKPFELEGGSFGVPAALAIVSRLGNSPRKPVLATGKLTEKGIIDSVGHIEEKIEAAAGELGDSDGFIFVPVDAGGSRGERVFPVRSLSEVFSILEKKEVSREKISRPPEKPKAERSYFTAVLLLVIVIFFGVGLGGGYIWLHGKGREAPVEPVTQPAQEEKLPEIKIEGFEKEIEEVLEAYRGLQTAYEQCHRDDYYGFFVEELDRYYNKEPAPLDFLKSKRDVHFGPDCKPLHGHQNAAIQFIEISRQTAVFNICPSGSWTGKTCVDTETGGPWKLAKLLGFRKVEGSWKVFFEFSGKDKPTSHHKHDIYRSYKIDPDAWVTVWE